MEAIKHIATETNGTDEGRFAAEDFLFAVGRPANECSALSAICCLRRLLARRRFRKEYADKAAEFVQHGDLKSAESELRKAVDLSPANPTLLTSLGGVLGMEGQFKQANVFLAQAVKLQPDEPMLRRNLAANEWQLGRFQEARRDLELLLRADPNDKGATFLLGMVSENEKNYRRSIALLESIPDVAEHQPEASVALASSYYHTNQNQKARAALKNVLNRPANPQVLMMAGRVAIDAHDYPLALTILTEAAGAMPDSYQVSLLKSQANEAPIFLAGSHICATSN